MTYNFTITEIQLSELKAIDLNMDDLIDDCNTDGDRVKRSKDNIKDELRKNSKALYDIINAIEKTDENYA